MLTKASQACSGITAIKAKRIQLLSIESSIAIDRQPVERAATIKKSVAAQRIDWFSLIRRGGSLIPFSRAAPPSAASKSSDDTSLTKTFPSFFGEVFSSNPLIPCENTPISCFSMSSARRAHSLGLSPHTTRTPRSCMKAAFWCLEQLAR